MCARTFAKLEHLKYVLWCNEWCDKLWSLMPEFTSLEILDPISMQYTLLMASVLHMSEVPCSNLNSQ